MRRLLMLTLLLSASRLSAQGSATTIAPGMSRAKVVAALGAPATERSVAEFTYLFYKNSCAKTCGMNDLVILRGDSVVDAIFRSPTRHYSGTSSSPAPITQKEAAVRQPSSAPSDAKTAKPAKAPTSASPRMKPPAQANDTRPSIPTNPPTLRPASPSPSSSPKTRTP